MLKFKIVRKSRKNKARIGILETAHGVVKTPCLVPVATQASIKTLSSEEIEKTKSQILICNTYHLSLRPGELLVEQAGGIHKFMNWSKPLMTDSGGFQVFSLGFGKDRGTGKIIKGRNLGKKIKKGEQPKFLKIAEEGVYFRSFLDGKKIFLSPEKSIKIQEALKADIIFAFDECTSPLADYEYSEKSLERTHRWAVRSLEAKNKKNKQQSIFGIIQGGKFKNLRIKSAEFIASLPFDGFGIGGEFGNDKKKMMEMLGWVTERLPEKKPRHLLGVGYPEDIPKIIKKGVDLFDCSVPTHYARRGIAFTSKGRLDLNKKKFLTLPDGKKPIDPQCSCFVCLNYKRNYICHLLRAKEMTAFKLLTFHNLYYFNSLVEKAREEIK
jgi:queuine tRNA-ribosyltransferase